MSDDAEDPEWGYVCEGCQSKTDPATGETYRVDKVRDGLNTEGTAELLASIHATKTGHSPEVEQLA